MNSNIKISTLYLLDTDLRFLKEICTKLNIENFLFYDKSCSSLEIIAEEILKIDENVRGIILPPILFKSSHELDDFLQKISSSHLSLVFIEIQIKINITNFHIMKNFFYSFENKFQIKT